MWPNGLEQGIQFCQITLTSVIGRHIRRNVDDVTILQVLPTGGKMDGLAITLNHGRQIRLDNRQLTDSQGLYQLTVRIITDNMTPFLSSRSH